MALACATALPSVCHAQQSEAELTKIIATLDTRLFNAVNTCDLNTLKTFWADDAEFLHDQAAPVLGRDRIVESIRTNLCGKVRRELVPGSMEVHGLRDYGAVELGVHQFLHPGAQDHGVVGEARFIHLWKHTDAGWQITRVISYEHHLSH